MDPRFGTSRGVSRRVPRGTGVDVHTINGHRDPYFGGLSPQCDAPNLVELGKVVVSEKRALGLATDGDADRFGVLDADGTYLNPNHGLMLLADRLLPRRKPGDARGVARSVATTHGLDAVAKAYGAPVFETAVGFKYIGELLLEEKIVMGGEESAGFTMEGHVPEKDGARVPAPRRARRRERPDARRPLEDSSARRPFWPTARTRARPGLSGR